MKRRIWLVTVAALTLLAPAAIAGSAQAENPGVNGQIAFERLAPNQPIEADGNGTVFVANQDGTRFQQVPLVYPTNFDTAVDWSPDGTKLLLANTIRFDSSGNCCLPFRPAILNPDGSGFTLLEMAYASQDMFCGAWTRDQKRLLCEFGGATPGIFSVRATDGGDPRRLTTNPYGSDDRPTDVSPDGNQFVFLRFRPGPQRGQRPFAPEQVALFVESLDGTGLRQITPYGVAEPHEIASAQWSPDGTQIISETTTGRLFTVHPDGSGPAVIHLQVGTANYFAFQAHWSPDETRIVFCLSINGGEGIYSANPDGSNVHQVTDAPTGFDNAPDWGTHPLAT